MKKSRNSFYDSKGRRMTACCDCTRGGNGDAVDKCSGGFDIKRGHLGCYAGTLIPGIEVTLSQQETDVPGVYELRTIPLRRAAQ